MNDLRLSRQEHVPQGTSICLTWTWTRQVIPLCMRRWKAVPPSGRSSEVLHCERALLHVTHTHIFAQRPSHPHPHSLTHSRGRSDVPHVPSRTFLIHLHLLSSPAVRLLLCTKIVYCTFTRTAPEQSRADRIQTQTHPRPNPSLNHHALSYTGI